MKIQKFNCPSCNAELDYNIDGHKEMFCAYCGQKFLIDDGNITCTINITNTNITRDEAKIEKAKIELEKEKLKIEQKKREDREALIVVGVGIFILIVVLPLLAGVLFQ